VTLRRWLILVTAVAAVVLAVLIIIRITGLHAVSFDPENGKATDSLHTITIRYNYDLSPKTTDSFQISPDVTGQATISGNTLRFTPEVTYALGTTYAITVKPIAKSGLPGSLTKLTFTADHNIIREPASSLLKALPHDDPVFRITYTTDVDGSLTLLVEFPTVPFEQQVQRADEIRRYKQKALDFIKQNGGDPSTLKIFYSPDPDSHETEENVHG
jgi:hypothetical protein